jgi:hypothetical protein
MRENARACLAALREKKPLTKAAQLRSLWPEIRAALDNGHSLKAISECLAADGIAVSVRSLSVYVGRLRKNSMAGKKKQSAALPAALPTAPRQVTPDPQPVAERAAEKFDPLRNFYDMEAKSKRTTFKYTPPTLADKDKLI